MDLTRILADLLVGCAGAVVGLLGTTRLLAWRVKSLEGRMAVAESDIKQLNRVNARALSRAH